jgi:hypothetical protein
MSATHRDYLKTPPPYQSRTGIPIHWKETGVQTIKIRHHRVGVVAPLALIAAAQRILASMPERQVT